MSLDQFKYSVVTLITGRIYKMVESLMHDDIEVV
jgi:hypothetical protein